MIAIPFVILLLLLAIGMPIGFALIAASLTTLYTLGLAPLTLVPDILYESVGHFTLLAIPFFLLAAELLSNSYMNAESIRLDGGIRMQPK